MARATRRRRHPRPLAIAAHRQTYIYHDLTTLYQDTVDQNPASLLAHYYLAAGLMEQGRTDEAIEHYRATLRIAPPEQWHRYGLSRAMVLTGQLDEGIAALEGVLQGNLSDHQRANANFHLANVLAMQDRIDEALQHYRSAVELEPRNASRRSTTA